MTEGVLRAMFAAAVAAADPMVVLPAHLPPRPPQGRLVVLGAGKASARMAETVIAHYGGGVEGVVVTRYGHGRPAAGVQIIEAGHPVPDAAGLEGTAQIMALAQGLGPQDLALVLISGGASALLCAPRGVDLAGKQAITAQLLRAGAPIGDINLIRKHLSRVKGGQLAAACAPAPVRALIISDVAGDDLADIGSGPTVGDSRDVAAVAARWGVTIPPGSGVLPSGDARLAQVENILVAAPLRSLEAGAILARKAGFEVEILGDALEGEAQDLGRRHAALALGIAAHMPAGSAPRMLISGGECTVTGAAKGSNGGPNAEYALALALGLAGHPRIHALAADTDGIDGAGRVAGAVVRPQTLACGGAEQALDAHDAHGFFARAQGQIITGPTLTNVNDFRAIAILPP